MILRIFWVVFFIGVATVVLWGGWRLISIILDKMERRGMKEDDKKDGSKD